MEDMPTAAPTDGQPPDQSAPVGGGSAVVRRMPTRLEDLGVPATLVEDLFLRRIHIARRTTIRDVSAALGISAAIGNLIAEDLRTRNQLEFHGMDGRDYLIGLTEQGRTATVERMRDSSYASICPVSLEEYTASVLSQKPQLAINRETVKNAFGDLVVSDQLLDQIGPAFLSDGAIFLYGPPGTGKTSLAERMIRMHDDWVLVPRAVEVESQIISLFDASIHTPAPEQPPGLDPRWVLCARPIVIAGGELTMDMLDLELDTASGVYRAPLQMLANNGILVIDDFGRQSVPPAELLNRWIIPLSRDIDYLKLANGTKFTVPFELKLVASTNLNPRALGDDAFLRRLRNKVFVGSIEDDAFNWILARAAQNHGLQVTAEGAEHLRELAVKQLGELRPYLAADFCELAVGICSYENLPLTLDMRMIDRVGSVYFVDDSVANAPKGAAERAAELAQKAAELAAESSGRDPLGFDPFSLTLHEG